MIYIYMYVSKFSIFFLTDTTRPQATSHKRKVHVRCKLTERRGQVAGGRGGRERETMCDVCAVTPDVRHGT
jgi:hypothetical protein